MTSLLASVPIERITTEARAMRPGRTLLLVVAGLFFALGWLVAKVFVVAWAVVTWIGAAVKVGWSEGRKTSETVQR